MNDEAVAQFDDDPDFEDEDQDDELIHKLPTDPADVEGFIEALVFGDSKIQPLARAHLVAMGDRVAMELLKDLNRILRGQGIENDGPEQICLALKELGEPTFQMLLRGLKSRKAGEVAAFALGHIGDRRAVEPLLETLANGHSEINSWAAEALGTIGDPVAIEPLTFAFLGNPKNRSYRSIRAAAFALAKLKVFEPLYSALEDKTNVTRYNHALQALKYYGDRSVVVYLQSLPNRDSYIDGVLNHLKTRFRSEPGKEEK